MRHGYVPGATFWPISHPIALTPCDTVQEQSFMQKLWRV